MLYDYSRSPHLSGTDRATLERTFHGLPDRYLCQVFHTPNLPTWFFWVRRGDEGYLLQFHRPELDGHEEELRHEMERALRAIDATWTGKENQAPPTLEEMVRLRMGDYERSLPPSKVEELAERGQLKGLEFMGPQRDPLRELKFTVRPVLHVTGGTIE